MMAIKHSTITSAYYVYGYKIVLIVILANRKFTLYIGVGAGTKERVWYDKVICNKKNSHICDRILENLPFWYKQTFVKSQLKIFAIF